MSYEISDGVLRALKKLGEIVGILAVIGVIGTYWINTEVERRMGELVPNAGNNPTVIANKTKLETLAQGQARIENKVDTFSTEFTKYLQRQIELAEANGQ